MATLMVKGLGTPVQGVPDFRYLLCGKRGISLKHPHIRNFVKQGKFIVPRYEVWGSKCLTIHEKYASLTPSYSLCDWGSQYAVDTCCR